MEGKSGLIWNLMFIYGLPFFREKKKRLRMLKSLQKCLRGTVFLIQNITFSMTVNEKIFAKGLQSHFLFVHVAWDTEVTRRMRSHLKRARPENSANISAALYRTTPQHHLFPSKDAFTDCAQIWLFHLWAKSSNQAQNRNCMMTDTLFISKQPTRLWKMVSQEKQILFATRVLKYYILA